MTEHAAAWDEARAALSAEIAKVTAEIVTLRRDHEIMRKKYNIAFTALGQIANAEEFPRVKTASDALQACIDVE